MNKALFISLLISLPVFGNTEESQEVPYFENGKMTDYREVNLEKKDNLDQLEIKDGDVIKEVHGEPVDSPAAALDLYNQD